MRTVFYSIFISILSAAAPSHALDFHNVPDALLSYAISSDVIYDDDFDYAKLGKISNLDEGFSSAVRKNLVDHVIVNKSYHQMFLMRGNQVVKTFWIALSDRPQGPKQYEGDRRTPEGTYTLDYVKERSSYYKAFHISYPNYNDIEKAKKLGKRPGGMIMVHGQPPSSGGESVQRSDWTNGCIALLNKDLDTFLSMVDVGTPITIKP